MQNMQRYIIISKEINSTKNESYIDYVLESTKQKAVNKIESIRNDAIVIFAFTVDDLQELIYDIVAKTDYELIIQLETIKESYDVL
jgi:predicted house-cleaning NTP pyrophosphatase (Maf/HAM1 superfamily)